MLFLNFGKRAKNLLRHPCPAIGAQLTVASEIGAQLTARQKDDRKILTIWCGFAVLVRDYI
jgi:hypothetical protein